MRSRRVRDQYWVLSTECWVPVLNVLDRSDHSSISSISFISFRSIHRDVEICYSPGTWKSTFLFQGPSSSSYRVRESHLRQENWIGFSRFIRHAFSVPSLPIIEPAEQASQRKRDDLDGDVNPSFSTRHNKLTIQSINAASNWNTPGKVSPQIYPDGHAQKRSRMEWALPEPFSGSSLALLN